MANDLRYWLAIRRAPGVGDVVARKLVSALETPEAVFRGSAETLEKAAGVGPNRAVSLVEFFRGFADWGAVDDVIASCRDAGGRALTLSDEDYPEHLREIPDPPVVLFLKGELRKTDRYAVAIVGSRFPTGYGRRQAARLAGDLAARGVTVVSGMARGIDTEAHRAALGAGGRTLAVLGSGLDVVYPPENRGLFTEIAENGAVLTEFPGGTQPDPQNFPRRNRMISGCCLGTVVVEAARRSGSLITARMALEQGREVFAVPGNVSSPASSGANGLLKEGARLVESAEDILAELAPSLREGTSVGSPPAKPDRPDVPLSSGEESVLLHLESEPRHVDVVVRRAGLATPETLQVLLSLEMKGLVEQEAGMQFRRI